MGIRLIEVPYDSGRRDWRMGRGPAALVAGGGVKRLSASSPLVRDSVEAADRNALEIGLAFELQRGVADAVRRAAAAGERPLVMSGNCHVTLGALAGLGTERVGLAWFDSHGDLNTPETSRSGFLDGMALAMIAGDCWSGPTATVEGFRPLADDRIALIGVRDLDPGERRRLRAATIRTVPPADLRSRGASAALEPLLADWGARLAGIYVHMDLDVHDPEEGPVNPYQAPAGPSAAEVRDCVTALAACLPLVGCTFSAYAPDGDPEGRALAVALDLVEVVGREMTRR